MLTFAIRRLIVGVPVIMGIALLVFLVLLVMPGNPAELIQGEMANPEVTQALVAKWGLDEPAPVRLKRWAGSVLHLDFGQSLVTGRPVIDMLLPRIGWSAFLGVIAIVLSVLLGLPIGILSAVRPNSPIDYLSTLVALVGLSLPVFVTGLILQLALGAYLKILPISGAPSSIWSLHILSFAILPALAIATHHAAIIARVTRTTLLEIIQADYMRTAHSKGLSERQVILRHAIPNVMIPVVTLIGVRLKTIISGLLVVEIVFGWPGMGRLFYDAVMQRDYPVIQGVALTIAIGVYLINLIVDLTYGYLDPRIRVEGGASK